MDPLGILVWVVTALVVAAVVGIPARMMDPVPLWPAAAYVITAAFLATFMGSEAFSWLSEKGPEVDGFFILTGAAFGLAITVLAALAARAPALSAREDF